MLISWYYMWQNTRKPQEQLPERTPEVFLMEICIKVKGGEKIALPFIMVAFPASHLAGPHTLRISY
jgi:hypothetical protein